MAIDIPDALVSVVRRHVGNHIADVVVLVGPTALGLLYGFLRRIMRPHMPRRNKLPDPPANVPADKYPQWFLDCAQEEQRKGDLLGWLGEYEGADMLSLICSILSGGGALFLSATRDGGALSVTVMYGDEKRRLYIKSPEDLDEFVRKTVPPSSDA